MTKDKEHLFMSWIAWKGREDDHDGITRRGDVKGREGMGRDGTGRD